jgi:hypothetical protein
MTGVMPGDPAHSSTFDAILWPTPMPQCDMRLACDPHWPTPGPIGYPRRQLLRRPTLLGAAQNGAACLLDRFMDTDDVSRPGMPWIKNSRSSPASVQWAALPHQIVQHRPSAQGAELRSAREFRKQLKQRRPRMWSALRVDHGSPMSAEALGSRPSAAQGGGAKRQP